MDQIAIQVLQPVVPVQDALVPGDGPGLQDCHVHDVLKVPLPRGEVSWVDVASLKMCKPGLDW